MATLRPIGTAPVSFENALVLNWTNRDTAPAELCPPAQLKGKSAVVVLADQIAFDGVSYNLSAWLAPAAAGQPGGPPKRLVIVADTIRLTGGGLRVQFSGQNKLGGGNERPQLSAGHTLVFARRVVREGAATMAVTATGATAISSGSAVTGSSVANPNQTVKTTTKTVTARHVAGDGGSVTVCCEQYEVNGESVPPGSIVGADGQAKAAAVIADVAGGAWPKDTKDTTATETLVERTITKQVGVARVPIVQPPVVTKGSTATPAGPAARGSAGAVTVVADVTNKKALIPEIQLAGWYVHVLEGLELRLLDAIRQKDEPTAIGLLRRYAAMRAPAIPPELARRNADLLGRLNALRAAVAPALWTRVETVAVAGGTPVPVSVFVEGDAAEVRVAPTNALIVSRAVGGRAMLGTLKHDPRQAQVVTLDFEARLTFDPKLGALLDKQLARQGERRAGVFTRWELKPRKPDVAGFNAMTATLVGDALQCTVTLDTERASTALWQLAGDAGMPVEFDWEHKPGDAGGGGGKAASGTFTIRFSLGRRTETGLAVRDGKLANTRDVEATVAYLTLPGAAAGAPVTFCPPKAGGAVTIHGQDAVPLDLFDTPAGADLAKAEAPPEAVSVAVDPFSFDGFQMDEGLEERVTVRNLLPAVDGARQTQLEYVEVRLVQLAGDGAARAETPTEWVGLSPAGSQGDKRTFSFVKPEKGAREYRLEGTAYYKGGGKDALKPRTAAGPTIDIEPGLLPGDK